MTSIDNTTTYKTRHNTIQTLIWVPTIVIIALAGLQTTAYVYHDDNLVELEKIKATNPR
jgi:hypothetical protein